MNELGAAYLAAEGFEQQLESEISGIVRRYGRLFLTDLPPQRAFWAQNVWRSPFVANFSSISEAASLLKGKQRNWALFPYAEHRRAALIKHKLPYISEKTLVFPVQIPNGSLGSWMLLDRNTLLASADCSSKFPNGELHFAEDRSPPSRAYLKLWEALTVCGAYPLPGSRCLEIGASPGGWSWVLSRLGAQVICVDRAPLAPEVAAMPGITFAPGNAFAMTPQLLGKIDWIFSDVACYPEKLLEWVHLWLKSGMCANFICTLKFQGGTTYEAAQAFAAIPGGRVVHLGYNKHELTWMLLSSAKNAQQAVDDKI